MSLCEMCGTSKELVSTVVEGVQLKVCSGCSKYGQVQQTSSKVPFGGMRPLRKTAVEGPSFKVVANYSSLIRSMREKKGLSQEDFAKSLTERESVVAKWEAGTLTPSIETARKISKILHITLLEKDEEASVTESSVKTGSSKGDALTLGDFVRVRTRK